MAALVLLAGCYLSAETPGTGEGAEVAPYARVPPAPALAEGTAPVPYCTIYMNGSLLVCPEGMKADCAHLDGEHNGVYAEWKTRCGASPEQYMNGEYGDPYSWVPRCETGRACNQILGRDDFEQWECYRYEAVCRPCRGTEPCPFLVPYDPPS